MKIRNKFIIPILAVIIAMLMVGGSVSGTAVDTSAPEETSTTHPLTYIPPTAPPTSSLDEEINAVVSGLMSEYVSDPNGVGSDIRESSGIFAKIIKAITGFIDTIMNLISSIGDKLGGM